MIHPSKKGKQLLEWEVYATIDQLSLIEQQVLQLAKEHLQYSHSPYSNFKVGTGLLLENGELIGGSNQENASYPLCLCAERVALAAAASIHPHTPILTLAVTVKHPEKIISKPAMPCGACRQVICEVEQKQQQAIRILTQGEQGEIFVFPSGLSILPLAFDASYL